jgi:hypothetical protein
MASETVVAKSVEILVENLDGCKKLDELSC